MKSHFPAAHPVVDSRELIVLAVGVLLVALSVAGSGLYPDSWWGLHLWSFLPAWSFVAALIAVAGTVTLLITGGRGRAKDRVPAAPVAATRPKSFLPVLALAALFCLVAWICRVRHILLGDGIPLVQHLAIGVAFHPREPLTYVLQAALFRLLNAIAPAANPELTAARAVATGSIAAGALFVPVAWGLAGEILRQRHDRPDEKATAGQGGVLATVLLVLVFLAQGYALLFFGYVENYDFLVTATAFTLLAGLRAARGAWPLWVPGIAAVIATALHISAALLFPGWLLLVALRARHLRRRGLVDLAVVGLAFLGAALLLGHMEKGYSWVGTILTVGRVTTTSGIGGVNKSYIGSAAHVRDFVNEHWLLGPFAFFLLVPAAVRFLLRRRRPGPGDLFIGTTALLWFLAVSRIADSNLGYARDWDLQSPAGFCFAAAGLYFLMGAGRRRLSDARLLSIVLVFSLFQFVPWVAINASPRLALARVERLPLGHGRSEVLVGTWYQREGRLDEAEHWYRKALSGFPESHAAWCGLGSVAFQKQEYERAAHLFGVAVKLKPEFAPYRASLVSSLMHEGRNDQALTEFAELLKVDPANGTTWLQYASLLRETGRIQAARDALRRSFELEPASAAALQLKEELDAARADSLAPVQPDSAFRRMP